jgi:glucose-1-phosphate thymidylyltransferase
MINWGIEALVNAGITEIMLVTGGTHAGEFLRLLGNGHEFGIDRLSYGYQEKPGGIAEALGLAARFVDGDPGVGDVGRQHRRAFDQADGRCLPIGTAGARILLTPVEEDEHLRHLGVPDFRRPSKRVTAIVEKPERPGSPSSG